ncbi:uncharacterized protein METZ01_LOCUS503629, partial [marine metagenome]
RRAFTANTRAYRTLIRAILSTIRIFAEFMPPCWKNGLVGPQNLRLGGTSRHLTWC